MDELLKLKLQDDILERYAESLNISQTRFKEAEARYTSIGDWLHRDESSLKDKHPEVYTQGSFRLGTVIKPSDDNEEYDIDLVCQLDYSKNEISQKQLKELLGKELLAYAKSNSMKAMPEESKRCWIMNYADGAQFHIDVLPCVEDRDDAYLKRLVEASVDRNLAKSTISITDNTLLNYPIVSPEWLKSNPKGYSIWFRQRMGKVFAKRAHVLVEQKIYASVEEVPSYEIKTPLQKSIQILKRHRDNMFKKNDDNKPISIIISTLAAKAYNGEEKLSDALRIIIKNMHLGIEKDNGLYIVRNPVRPEENFADKWKEYPEREKAFFKWLEKVRADVAEFERRETKADMIEALGLPLGGKVMKEVMSSFGVGAPAIKKPVSPTYPEVKSQPGKPWMKW